ncbi:MAG TPA: efflux RND transporter periplasmic adaptor subunit, partial [Bacteroidota bacterium]|nr:efflux RND transporter periplasmic adaptor subunit [Bacteroidota bacterium]
MSEQGTDLSRLRIKREEAHVEASGAPKRISPLYYVGGVVVVLAVGFMFFRSSLTPVPEVELTSATMVSPNSANSLLTASGYVVAQRKASIASKATGRLISLGFDAGDQVKKG